MGARTGLTWSRQCGSRQAWTSCGSCGWRCSERSLFCPLRTLLGCEDRRIFAIPFCLKRSSLLFRGVEAEGRRRVTTLSGHASSCFFCSSVRPRSAATRESARARVPASRIKIDRSSLSWRESRTPNALVEAPSRAARIAACISSRIFVRAASSLVSFIRCRKGSNTSRPGEPDAAASDSCVF